jgi:glycosyltransferase involved in cell wall biosynthesis
MATLVEERVVHAPVVSVVVASPGRQVRLEACLDSLREQCAACAAEQIVVRACDPDDAAALAESYPYARFITRPADTPAPQLRAVGLRAAGGDIVALMDDHCVAAEDWIAKLVSHYGPGSS